MKLIKKNSILTTTLLCASFMATEAANYAWPENFEGVMLQGFYWDSFQGTNNTKWKTLTANSDELSKYFKVIWVPNSAKAASNPGMGYDPVYWFTNHNTAFGTEAELKTMIQTFRDKGTDIIEDVVINHRSGKSNWTDFPAETWNGVTYQLGPQHICNTDEVRNAAGQAKPTGAADTGEDFDGSRDLDHTNKTVQDNCKAYCSFLINELGYAGFRYDMTKGYSGYYNKIYNEASKPKYSVGEYWDGNYDKVRDWIEATGRQSAAFDFPGKYAINEAFSSGDMTKLVWKANGTTDQPAGMIHFGYQQYAVTFIDNHDTYRDDWNKFKGNLAAAYAFILCSPGTPCVFYPHYLDNKSEIQALIDVRNAVGIHNQSAVKVLRSSNDCYMAEVTGKKGTLVVKIGSSWESPSGYTASDIKASGNDYCIWSKVSSTPNPNPVNPNTEFSIYFDNSASGWTKPYIYYWPEESPEWPGVAMSPTKENPAVWQFTVPAGTTGCIFNAGDGDASKTNDFIAIANHIYDRNSDMGEYSTTNPSNYPENVYLVGNLNSLSWASANAIPQQSKPSEGIYCWNDISFDDSTDGYSYFSFLTALDKEDGDWTLANASDRYGAASADELIQSESGAKVVKYAASANAASANAWKTIPAKHNVRLNLKEMILTLDSTTSSISITDSEDNEHVMWYDLLGRRIRNPRHGIFIKVSKGVASKIAIP